MSRFDPSHSALLAAAGTVILGATTFTSLHGQPATKTTAFTDPALRVADALDAIAQPRFQDTTQPQFGTGRMVPPIPGHNLGGLTPKTPAETKALAEANGQRRNYVISLLHCAHVPGHQGFPSFQQAPSAINIHTPLFSVPQVPSPYLSPLAAGSQPVNFPFGPLAHYDAHAIQKSAVAALPRLVQGKPAQATVGNWLVVMRPIRALQASCLGCHTGAKHGDTLGVMVYAVNRTANPSPKSATRPPR